MRRLHRTARESGFTLAELMIVLLVLAIVISAITAVLLSSSRQTQTTSARAGAQGGARQALSLMTTEVRQAGADPSIPPVGIVGIVSGDSISVHVRADLDGNGTISTTEPSEDVTYRWDSGARTLSRNPGTGASTLIGNVTQAQFTYFDDTNAAITALPLSATDAARVKSIGMSFTVSERGAQPVTLTTRVNLRNR